MWKLISAAFAFVQFLFTNKQAAQEKQEKKALYEANKALLERDRDRDVRRAARVIRAGVLREEASEAPTVSIPANTH